MSSEPQRMNGIDDCPLLVLPPELQLRICTYLSPELLWTVIRRLNRHFRTLLQDDVRCWKRLTAERHRNAAYPTKIADSPRFSWLKACCSLTREKRRWHRRIATETSSAPDFSLIGGHYAAVDAVHLLRPQSRLCLSGGRDRKICLWDLNSLGETPIAHQTNGKSSSCASLSQSNLLFSKDKAHKGWIWAIASRPENDSFYSAGWDCHINQWQLTESNFQLLASSGHLTSAVLQVVMSDPGLIVASTFNKRVLLLDPRVGLDGHLVATLNYHQAAVLGLTTTDDNSPYLYSCGEDRNVFCIDKRTWTPVTQRTLTRSVCSVHYAYGQLSICCGGGFVATLDPHTDGLPSFTSFRLSSLDTAMGIGDPVLPALGLPPSAVCRVRQVWHNLGAIFTVSADRYLRIISPGLKTPPYGIARLGQFPGEPTKMDYVNGTLACAFSDNTVGIWKRGTII